MTKAVTNLTTIVKSNFSVSPKKACFLSETSPKIVSASFLPKTNKKTFQKFFLAKTWAPTVQKTNNKEI